MSGAEPPPGYLGAGGPIGRGPAPELVEAGYELELADAPLLAAGSGSPTSHTCSRSTRSRTATGVRCSARWSSCSTRRSRSTPATATSPTSASDVLEQRIGSAAGWLNAGRPRREAGRIAFRIALRSRVLDLAAAVARFATALIEVAARERDTPMPDYTYLQAAQPTTAGHWLLSFAYPALRDLERLQRRLRVGQPQPGRRPAASTARASRSTASGSPRCSASAGPIDHTRDANWQTDGLADADLRTPRSPRRRRAGSPRTSSSTPATSSACSGSATSCAAPAR